MDNAVNKVLENVKQVASKKLEFDKAGNQPAKRASINDSSSKPSRDHHPNLSPKDLSDQALTNNSELQIYREELCKAVYQSQQLLNYAADAGKEVDIGISKTISEFSHKIINGESWSPLEETKFRNAGCKLAKYLSPVTFDTLLSSTKRVNKYVKAFGALTILLLGFLVYAQFVWVVLNNATQTIDLRQKEMDTALMNIDVLSRQNSILQNQLDTLATPKTDPALLDARRRELEENLQKNSEAIITNTTKYNVADDLVKSSAGILAAWLPFQGWLKTTEQELTFRNKALQTTWAKQILQGMSAYLLPLIYGLVGACAFVLRAMSHQIRERTFSTADSSLQFGLRLVLGALAGISIGWFLKPEPSADDLISSLSPLALAFIAGYSVELVFTAVDKIISAFSGSGPGEHRKQAAN